jgi:hypothetical protein
MASLSLSIPAQIAEGLIVMGSLPDDVFQELFSNLENLPLKIPQSGFVDDSSLRIDSILPDELDSINAAIFPLINGHSNSKTATSDYVESVVLSLKEQASKEGNDRYSEDVLKRVGERLTQVLQIRSLRLVGKARAILLKHERTFSNGRVLSDIRPVFGESVDENPLAAVIVHMLNLTYYKEGERRDFVVALDTNDIQLLIDVLNRAQTKTKILESIITSTGMKYIEVS